MERKTISTNLHIQGQLTFTVVLKGIMHKCVSTDKNIHILFYEKAVC